MSLAVKNALIACFLIYRQMPSSYTILANIIQLCDTVERIRVTCCLIDRQVEKIFAFRAGIVEMSLTIGNICKTTDPVCR
jgi:hypothetical protein